MRTAGTSEQYVGVARRASLGALLRIGPEPLSVAWSCPQRGVHAAGLGVAGTVLGDVSWLGSAPPVAPVGPWFGGFAFDAERPWPGFPAERWVLPEVLSWWSEGASWLAAFGRAGVSRSALESRLDAVSEVDPVVDPPKACRSPSQPEAWAELVHRALELIAAGAAEKLVCARVIEVLAERPWSERAVLKALEARHPQCFTFLVRGDDGRAFLGATPETLLVSDGDAIETEALAGTSAVGEGQRLLEDDKTRREHAAVVLGITRALAPLTSAATWPPAPTVKALSNVDHLCTPIRAQLRPGVSAHDVARRLHPTPAVAGTPTGDAVRWLRTHEGFSRGWYAGAVGVRGPRGLTLAVALRSALLDGARAQVFVGAGIVEGSTPQAEWLETERKARAVLPALGAHDA